MNFPFPAEWLAALLVVALLAAIGFWKLAELAL
jgi:uncharacterized membrane protein